MPNTGGTPTTTSGGGTGTPATTTGTTPPAGTTHSDWSMIQTSGTGDKWKDANPDPNTWKVVPMTDDPSKFKVVDDKGKNIATEFPSKELAQEYIDYKKTPSGGTGTGTGTDWNWRSNAKHRRNTN